MPSDHLPVWAYVYWLLPICSCSYHDPAAYDNGGYHNDNNPAYYDNGSHYHYYNDHCSGFLFVRTASGWFLSGL